MVGVVVPPPTAAQAEEMPAAVPLAEAAVPVIRDDGATVALLASQGETALDPASVRFSASAGDSTTVPISMDMTADAGQLDLRYELVDVPEGGSASIVAVRPDGQEQSWIAGETLQLAAEGIGSLSWTFSAPGEYRIRLVATVSRAVDGDVLQAEAMYRFDVAGSSAGTSEAPVSGDADASTPAEAAQTDAGPEPADTVPDADTAPAPAADETITVLSEGDVRLASQLADGRLTQSVMTVAADGSFERHPVASTVISLPNSEPWPGTGAAKKIQDTWAEWVPGQGEVWRTLSRMNPDRFSTTPANPMRISFDTGFVPWSGADADLGATLVSMEEFETDGSGDFFVHDGKTTMTSTSFRRETGQQVNSWPGKDAPAGSDQFGRTGLTEGFVFTAPGRYCVTTRTESTNDDGTLKSTATYTFAIGIDPATVTPCAQPEGSGGGDPTDPGGNPGENPDGPGRIVSGQDVALAARLDGGTFSLGGYVAGEQAEWFDPASSVIDIPTRDDEAWPLAPFVPDVGGQAAWRVVGDAGDRLFRTTAVSGSTVYPGSVSAQVVPDASFVPRVQVVGDQTVHFELGAVEAPDGGRLTSTLFAYGRLSVPRSDQYWNSADRNLNGAIHLAGGSGGYAGKVGGAGYGLAFDEPGRYCVTVRASATLRGIPDASAWQTYTFAVGVDPASVQPCAQRQDGIVAHEDPDAGLYDDVTYLRYGHSDIGTRVVGDELQLYVGDEMDGTAKEVDLDDIMIIGRGPFVEQTVVSSGQTDTTIMGEVGQRYYRFLAASGEEQKWAVWPGINTSKTGGYGYTRTIDFKILGVEGPGKVVLADGGAISNGEAQGVIYSSDPDDDAQYSTPLAVAHIHMNWMFSEPGRYCINIEAKARNATANGSQDRVTGMVTFVVGDVDLQGMLPCDRPGSGATAVVDPEQPVQIDPAAGRIVSDSTAGVLEQNSLYLDGDGRLQLGTTATAQVGGTPIWRDPESVVRTSSSPSLGRDKIQLVTGRLHEHLQSDVQVRLGAVTGPGTYQALLKAGTLNSAADAREVSVWAGWSDLHVERFSAPGQYCVPITYSATIDGARQSITKTLTYVINRVGPGQEGYVDPAGVTLCVDGGEGTDPGEGPGENPGEDTLWDVPNGTTTASGARIINDGHVDIASIMGDGLLDTKIKDDTTGGSEPDYLEPEKTVLQVTPFAQTRVTSAAQGFIAEVGDVVWQVDETPQDGLLWPGWSTERVPLSSTIDGVDWRLKDVDGPGEVAVFSNGAAQVYFNTKDGITDADRFTIPKNTHTHANWTFTAEGVYCLAWERSATASDGQRVSDAFVTAFAVGAVDVRKIDPSACFTEPSGRPGDDERGEAPTGLDDLDAGDVQVIDADRGFTPGQLVTVQAGRAHAGQWVSAWLDESWLGWAHVGASGAFQIRLPADAAPGGHRLVVTDRAGDLIGWDAISVVAAVSTPGGGASPAGDGTPAATAVAAQQCVAGATVLSSGHIDYASRIVGGKLESLIGDDSSGTKVYRQPAGTVLWLKPSAREGGVWRVPQTQDRNLIWLGWSTEALNAGNAQGAVRWTIDGIDGPGRMQVYTSGPFGGIQEMVFDGGGVTSIALGVHAHANWEFSAVGIYRIRMTQTVTLANGQRSSDTETLTIAVGNVDPASAVAQTGSSGCGVVSNALLLSDEKTDAAARAADQVAADAAEAARDRLPGTRPQDAGALTNPLAALEQGDPVPLLLSVLGLLLLVGAAGSGALWWRRRGIAG